MRNKTPLWKAIATALRTDLADGLFRPGDKIPTEAELATRFGVNRHTVRHALAQLIEEGLLRSRRGAGVFVQNRPTDYPIGKRVRFHENILASGRTPHKVVLGLTRRAPSPSEGKILRTADPICVYSGISLVDDGPIALFESCFALSHLPGIYEALQTETSVTKALRSLGVADYTRASTRLTAVPADATQAVHLHIEEGAPLMRSSAINVDGDGRPLEFGRTWFVGDRVTLTFEG